MPPFDRRDVSSAESYNRMFGDMEPDHPDFRAFDDTTTRMMGELYHSLGLDRDPEKWKPGDSEYLTGVMSDPDKRTYLKAIGSRAKALSKAEANDKAENLSSRIFKHWEHLNQILVHCELVIRKRWMKRSRDQRKAILFEAWPSMSKKRRPDFDAYRREPQEQRETGSQFEEAYTWPYVNLEDLCTGNNLLLFLNARGRHLPATFVFSDLESFHVGHFSKALPGNYILTLSMNMTGTTPQTYGRVFPTTNNLVSIIRGSEIYASDGLEILEAQERVKFNDEMTSRVGSGAFEAIQAMVPNQKSVKRAWKELQTGSNPLYRG